ncbi:sigma factor-like helix-turn-helix DNA-binding protein [Stomatohabitans albus]|uniref:sigma factor-like helix-turn-helix DNA-binding protein n=1 Tax=Stomatohabitans albus TaxID=3110766 RepID=UPI00300CAF7C
MTRHQRRSPVSAEQAQLNKRLRAVLARLPEIERKVLECRMGLVDGEPKKPGETASHLGLTINEMKKIEARAFSRIREVGNLKGLAKHLDTK